MSERSVWERLAEPFPPEDLEWRVGSTTQDKSRGLALAYLTARAVMDRLDSVLGPANWTDDYEALGQDGFLCRLRVRVDGEWVQKTDAAGRSDIEGVKGGVSDALKRAAVKVGVGRYLYHLPNVWAPLRPAGRSYAIADDWTPNLPPWALPGGQAAKPAPAKEKPEPSAAARKAAAESRKHSPAFAEPPAGKTADELAESFQGHLEATEPNGDAKGLVLPEWADELVGMGKFGERRWADLVAGSPDGGRRAWLRWMEDHAFENWQEKKVKASKDEARASDLLNALREAGLEKPRA